MHEVSSKGLVGVLFTVDQDRSLGKVRMMLVNNLTCLLQGVAVLVEQGVGTKRRIAKGINTIVVGDSGIQSSRSSSSNERKVEGARIVTVGLNRYIFVGRLTK